MAKNIFNSIQLNKPKANGFDLSHDVKLSGNMGELIPIMVQECIPGDKYRISCESLLRFAPLVSPVMHRMDVSMHYFFVPNRIVWDGWEEYITNTKPGGVPRVYPTLYQSGETYTRLADYLGIPTPFGPDPETVSAIPFAAYQAIWNEFYRDQNLQTALNFKLVDGDNTANTDLLDLRRRCWQHDYFTASLPFAQKGSAVTIPIADFKDVNVYRNSNTSPNPVTVLDATTGTDLTVVHDPSADIVLDDRLYAQTSDLNAEQSTINTLRRAFRLQEWLEKAARGGSRYVENILSFFGVKSPDMRLQRPEYITGTKSPVVISEVLNTSGAGELPQGNMAGHAVSVTEGQYGAYFCQEHGFIIGVMSVMPKTAYQQGIPKHFLKTTDPFQFYWPQFANIGEQEVLKKEVYAFQGATGNETFGYVPRYAEYKYNPSRVAGDFRNTLAFWHLGRIFINPPELNAEFVECNPSNRIFAVEDDDVQHLYVHVYNKVMAIRRMPKFGTPSF